jgi:ribosomal protein L20
VWVSGSTPRASARPTYGQLISGLKAAGVGLDRKSLAELAPSSTRPRFAALAKQAQNGARARSGA